METNIIKDDVNAVPDGLNQEPAPPQDNNLNEGLLDILKKFTKNGKVSSILKNTGRVLITLVSITLFLAFFLYLTPIIQEMVHPGRTHIDSSKDLKANGAYKKLITQTNRDIQRLSRKYGSYTSGQTYLVINTTDNLFYLYRNKKLIRDGHCSTGSFKMLKTEEGRSWIFKTPKGKFTIQGKQTNPAWRRPDWAFVEEGLPVPERQDDPSRYEFGVLGDYALALGDGYLIHGTIYKRFLGMPVTHGCVRLNDDDLKAVFNSLSIGSKVYIF